MSSKPTKNRWRRFQAWHNALKEKRFLSLRVSLAGSYRITELYRILFWAGLVGLLGGISSFLFRKALAIMAFAWTGKSGGLVEIFSNIPQWQRLVLPLFGGLAAGIILHFGAKFKPGQKSTTDYMEAVVLGDGRLSFRSSIVKTLSAMFSISSGSSIGREGPMVQLAALAASLVGQTRNWSVSRRRLILACGATAGIASAYNAPIAGALFVAEIVLGSIAMEIFGPLLFSSVMAAQAVHFLSGSDPIYGIPGFRLNSPWELLAYLSLGILAGLAAPWFLRALRLSERLFLQTGLAVYWRTTLGGLIVGILAVFYPQACGNGYSVVTGILHGNWLWPALSIILLVKLTATCASFGSGAVGGVFTPTLFMGAALGYLFGSGLEALPMGVSAPPGAFALAGMGMFLAATTHAPLMAIIMIFEMTLDYQIILPLMLGCVMAYFTSHAIEKNPIYKNALERKGSMNFALAFAELKVGGLMKENPAAVTETTRLEEIAKQFIAHTFTYLYVVNEKGNYVGAIALQDIKEHLSSTYLADLVIARDLVRSWPPMIRFSDPLEETLRVFSQHDGEYLPVVADGHEPRLMGNLSKTDVILALAERIPAGHENR